MATELEWVRRLRLQVESAIDRLRPALLLDGGNVELAGVDEDGAVSLLFQGACATCPAQLATLRLVIEPTLRREIPAVKQVIPVHPH
jgi:Fe-S cluster biogenesis protein NfuA